MVMAMTDKVEFEGHAIVKPNHQGIELFTSLGHGDITDIFRDGQAYSIKIEAIPVDLEELVGL